MSADFAPIYQALQSVLAGYASHLTVSADSANGYKLVTRIPSPFPQHKGQPMFFGAVRLGKGYVSYHLMPLYTNPALTGTISPALKKRMQGKSCFNFKTPPAPEILAELKDLTGRSLAVWTGKNWA